MPSYHAIHPFHCTPIPNRSVSKYDSSNPFVKDQRVLAATLLGAPFTPCLLWILVACPLDAFAAVLAFSAFFLLSAAAFFSLPSLIAFSRASVRWLAPCERLSLMTSREAPSIPRCCLTVRRVRFFAISYFWNILDQCWLWWLCTWKWWSCAGMKTTKSWSVGRFAVNRDSLRRYPFCAVGDRELSMQSGAGSCAVRREIRSCHIGNGRSCCHHERKASPANKASAVVSLLELPGQSTSEWLQEDGAHVLFPGKSCPRWKYPRRYASCINRRWKLSLSRNSTSIVGMWMMNSVNVGHVLNPRKIVHDTRL